MKKNRLPKYWVVQNDGSQLFKDTVIKYLNEITFDNDWGGTDTAYYYGYDGNSSYRGTNSWKNISCFRNNPTLLTLQEFIDLTTEEWIPERGEVVLVSDTKASWSERIYLCTIEGANFPHRVVSSTDNENYHNKIPFDVSSYRYIKQLPPKEEPKPTKLTVAEIESKLGYKVEIISDKN